MSKGGGDTVTTTSRGTSGPLDWQQPYLNFGLRRAEENFARSEPNAYTSRIAELLQGMPTDVSKLDPSKFYDMYDSTDVNQHLKGLSGFASSDPLSDIVVSSIGTGNIGDAWNTLADTARGSFLNANPYVNAMFDQASGRVGEQFRDYTVPQTDAAFARAGRAGSGSYALLRNDQDQTLGTTMGDLATNIYGGNYANERGLQQQAAGLLGSTGSNAISNAQSQRLNARQYLSDFGMSAAQNAYNAELSKLGFGLNALGSAGDPLDAYFDRVGTLYGTATEGSQTQPNPNKRTFGDNLASIGQLALAGASAGGGGFGSLGGLFGGGPLITPAYFGGGSAPLGMGSPSFMF